MDEERTNRGIKSHEKVKMVKVAIPSDKWHKSITGCKKYSVHHRAGRFFSSVFLVLAREAKTCVARDPRYFRQSLKTAQTSPNIPENFRIYKILLCVILFDPQ